MSSSVMYTLKNILMNGENSYTLDDLKNELGLTNDKSLVNFLLRLLKEEIEGATCDTMTYQKPVIEYVYDYLDAFLTEGRECDIESVKERLSLLNAYISKELTRIKSLRKSETKAVSSYEKDFWSSLSLCNSNVLKTIDISERYKGEDGDYYLLEDLVFNIKNLSFVQKVTTRFPRLLLECNKDGESFFSRLVIFYINILKDEATAFEDIVYYESVLDLFLENKHLKVDKKLKDTVNLAIDQLRRTKKIDKSIRFQRTIYLFHLKKKILGEEKYVENLKELNNKYKTNVKINLDGSEGLARYFNEQSQVYFDFTKKDVITIDPYGSMDLDDGLSLEKLPNNNYLLGVYIADVSNYIELCSNDDINALHKGETIYGDMGMISPMIPEDISIDYCSLLPGANRKVIAYFFEIEPDGNIKNHFFTKGIIKTAPVNRLSYSNVDHILRYGCDNQRLLNLLSELNRISGIGMMKSFGEEEPTPSGTKITAHSIVSKFMVLSNFMAAQDAKKEGLPFLYRSHQYIDPQLILDDNPNLQLLITDFGSKRDILNNVIAGSFSKATYSVDPLPHEGLSLDAYSHTTSPIRRYADLANQRLIKSYFIENCRDEKQLYRIEKMLREVASTLNNGAHISEQFICDYAHVLKK